MGTVNAKILHRFIKFLVMKEKSHRGYSVKRLPLLACEASELQILRYQGNIQRKRH